MLGVGISPWVLLPRCKPKGGDDVAGKGPATPSQCHGKGVPAACPISIFPSILLPLSLLMPLCLVCQGVWPLSHPCFTFQPGCKPSSSPSNDLPSYKPGMSSFPSCQRWMRALLLSHLGRALKGMMLLPAPLFGTRCFPSCPHCVCMVWPHDLTLLGCWSGELI